MQNYKRVMVVVSGDVYRLYSHEWHEFCAARAIGDHKVRVKSMGGYKITKLRKPYYYGGKDKAVVMSMRPEQFPVFRIAGWGTEQFQAELDKLNQMVNTPDPQPEATADRDLVTMMQDGTDKAITIVTVNPSQSPDRARLLATAKDAAMDANNEIVELYGRNWGSVLSRTQRDAFRAKAALADLRSRLSGEANQGNVACADLLKFSELFVHALEIIQEDR
jgi:hypothetical protein